METLKQENWIGRIGLSPRFWAVMFGVLAVLGGVYMLAHPVSAQSEVQINADVPNAITIEVSHASQLDAWHLVKNGNNPITSGIVVHTNSDVNGEIYVTMSNNGHLYNTARSIALTNPLVVDFKTMSSTPVRVTGLVVGDNIYNLDVNQVTASELGGTYVGTLEYTVVV